MRDILTILAAGSLMTATALIAPTLVVAVPSPAPVSQKAFGQRLSQAGGAAPVSTVSGMVSGEAGNALPRFAR
jgi:hypothetical protein